MVEIIYIDAKKFAIDMRKTAARSIPSSTAQRNCLNLLKEINYIE